MRSIIAAGRRRAAGDGVSGTAGRHSGDARLVLGTEEAGAADLAAALHDVTRDLASLAAAIAGGTLVPGSGEAGSLGTSDVIVEAEEAAYPVDIIAAEWGEGIPAAWSPDDPTGGGAYALQYVSYRISPGGQCGPSTEPDLAEGSFVVAAETEVVGACFNDAGTELIGDLLEVTLTTYAPA
jgi:hypothetical protein